MAGIAVRKDDAVERIRADVDQERELQPRKVVLVTGIDQPTCAAVGPDVCKSAAAPDVQ